ncbi:hypothetical protein HYALB_00010270 [Hymenoscyphus albidus]|uniref:FAD-binding domain-containing protein n=1 Tax=Hymenoscyphus albidus TaxID=595503 RepID=A0A9N9LQD2_9HELO|nr:hypothetical protein HYALB_00010270 [Hymenoscyphus albidus]
MTLPEKCQVLVVGGGPAGSYTASVLGREGIDTVLVEMEHHPRYHIGESLLPSFRHYLKFIDLDKTFDSYGFMVKPGAAFKMNPTDREGYTDFLATGGSNNYSWNVIRSEADEILFRHAAKSGAKTFEGIKINSIEFDQSQNTDKISGIIGRPVSAAWSSKGEGTNGIIHFDYIVDATGRAGFLNTKYLKTATTTKHSRMLPTGPTSREVAHMEVGLRVKTPFSSRHYEVLLINPMRPVQKPLTIRNIDESGWAWLIPLHDGTQSISVVMNQEIAIKKKGAYSSTEEFYMESLKQAPMLIELLGKGERVTPVNYALPYARIVGDAGCFIDPFFSSGVHLAGTGGLSAGTTIAASIKGDVDEVTAAEWHSNKIKHGYARFLIVVLSAYKQMRNQGQSVLADYGEDDFDRAFSFFRPVIQGTTDATSKITQAEFSKTIEFLNKAFKPVFDPPINSTNGDGIATPVDIQEQLTAEDMEALQALRKYHSKDGEGLENFTTDVIDGLIPRLEMTRLTLIPANQHE